MSCSRARSLLVNVASGGQKTIGRRVLRRAPGVILGDLDQKA
jgi:hypothetical protein